MQEGRTILVEGANAAMLDIDFGKHLLTQLSNIHMKYHSNLSSISIHSKQAHIHM